MRWRERGDCKQMGPSGTPRGVRILPSMHSNGAGEHDRGFRRRSLLMAAAVAVIVLSVQLVWLPRRLDRLVLTGDEPHYLITTVSLLEDRDADETNNYVGGTLQPHQTDADRSGVYSKHGLGLPLLLVAPYRLGGHSLVLGFLAAIGALTAANAALLAQRYCRSLVLAGAIGLALGLSCPLAAFGLLVFPEVPAALCVVYAARRLLARRNAPWQWALVGTSVAALPWLHQRFIILALGLALVAVLRHRRTMGWRDLLAAVVPPFVAGMALLAWWTYLYGRPLPASGDHAGFSGPAGFLKGAAGVLIDQQWGLLTYSPLLALAIATAAPFARSQRADALALALIAVPYAAFVADFSQWYGGLSAPARFLTAIVPLAGGPLGWWLDRLSPRAAWPVFGLFALPSLALMTLMLAEPLRLYTYPGGTALLVEAFEIWTGLPLTDWLPTFVGEFAWSSAALALAAVVGLAVLSLLSAWAWWMAGERADRSPVAPPRSRS